MQESPLVSVLVTLHNRERYIPFTIESILSSSFTDFEVIIVDDCSTDRSLDIARSFADQDCRIRLFENEANLGDYGNRMKAAGLARGKYLKYVDSDDLVYKHSLDVMVDGMERNGDCMLGLSHSVPEDTEPYPWRLPPQEAYAKQFLGRGCIGCGPSGAIINRKAFFDSGGFNKDWGVLSDTELWLRLSADSPILLFPPGLIWWRRHEGQEFSKANSRETYFRLGHELEMKVLDHDNCPLDEPSRLQARRRCKQRYARRLLSLAIKEFNLNLAWKLYRESNLTIPELLGGFRKYP